MKESDIIHENGPLHVVRVKDGFEIRKQADSGVYSYVVGKRSKGEREKAILTCDRLALYPHNI